MIRTFVFLFLFLFSTFCFSQKKINRYKNKERHGRWIIYQDSTNTKIDNTGKYRHGIPKGTWKYYDPESHLQRKEKYFLHRIQITHYYPNGKIRKKGRARIVTSDQLIHYFYYGDWLVYDTTGSLIKKELYKEGILASEIFLKNELRATTLNDSVIEIVRQLNASITNYGDSIVRAEKTFGKNSKEYQRSISMSNLNAIKVFDTIDKLVSKYGYPGKSLVGAEYAIVFSIISTAGLKYKEKYYDLIIDAADKAELDWSDVAFFVDKVKVAKKEKQVYGTQYKILDGSILFYPLENKELLNTRRKKAGLEEIDTSNMIFEEYK
jgi:hypothetical protein